MREIFLYTANGINLRRIVGIVRDGLFFRDSGNVIKASRIQLSSIYRSVFHPPYCDICRESLTFIRVFRKHATS